MIARRRTDSPDAMFGILKNSDGTVRNPYEHSHSYRHPMEGGLTNKEKPKICICGKKEK